MKNSEGSTWSIWDFHVHTPWSLLNNQFGDPESDVTWQRFLQKLDQVTREKNIVALGVTDYFTVDGYKRIVSEREKAKKQAMEKNISDYLLKGVFLFPNIELRIIPVTDKGKSINLHVLFNPEVIEIIDSYFLSNLEFGIPGIKVKCNRDGLIQLGKNIDKTLIDEIIALEVGMNQFKTNIDQVKAALEKNSRFQKNALIAIGNNHKDGLAGLADDALFATRSSICSHADIIFSPRDVDRNFYLGKDSRCSMEELISTFNGPKPCVHGSDAHTIEDLCSPSLERYCWVKAKPTWQGLLQILYEPEDRIAIQKESPIVIKNNYTITSIKISETKFNDEVKINKIDQPLSPNLVAIIGGRGSGKTALLDIISSCFKEGSKLFDENHLSSFVQRTLSRNLKQRSITEFPVKLRFLSGEDFDAIVGENNDYYLKSDVDYLTQNHFEDISSNTARLHDYILELFFGSFPEDKPIYDAFEEKMEQYQEEINGSILRMITIKKKIEDNLPSAKASEQEKIGELNDYQLRIDEIESKNSNEIKTEVKEISEFIAHLEEEKDFSIDISNKTDSLRELISGFLAEYNYQISDFNDAIKCKPSYFLIESEAPKFSQVYEVLDDDLQIANAEGAFLEGVISDLQEKIISFEGVEQELAVFYNKKREIQIDLDRIRAKLAEYTGYEREVTSLSRHIHDNFIFMIEEAQKQSKFLKDAIAKFESKSDNTLGNVSFINTINFSRTTYLHRINEDVNLIRSKAHVEILTSLYESLITALETNDSLDAIVMQIGKIAFEAELKSNVTRQSFIMHLFERSFRNNLQACLQGKPLEKLSMGERAVVLLKIVLSLGDKPLLIDQPEEHLDNRYVYSELVPTIRDIRNKRQIIIATHNANLVVNTDAEQIIVADYSDSGISYISGALEDDEIRGSIKSILEGGDEAFKKRERKYNLS